MIGYREPRNYQIVKMFCSKFSMKTAWEKIDWLLKRGNALNKKKMMPEKLHPLGAAIKYILRKRGRANLTRSVHLF